MAAPSITLEEVGAALAGLSALATAAFGVLDAAKAFDGGASNIGLKHIYAQLEPFRQALDAAAGPGRWRVLVRAHWLNGLPKADQKTATRNLLRLGLTPETAEAVAAGCHVDPAALKTVAAKIAKGAEDANLTGDDLQLLGRVYAVLDTVLDIAFERAEQQYRNGSRFWAGVIAVALAVLAQQIWSRNAGSMGPPPSIWAAVAVGLLAVPVAPVAKDLTSGLSAAMRALKTSRWV
jgi:hypothetical protein